MNIAGLIFLLAAHYFSGRGLLHLLRVVLSPVERFCLSLLAGVPLVSFVPCVLQLMHVTISAVPVLIATAVMTMLLSIPLMRSVRMISFRRIQLPVYYEWPFLLVFAALVFVSAWRSFYFPPYARDMLAGPELLAEYAVREKTMISSVFTIDLQTSNNYFKSPYITGLQIVYKLLVQEFGQVWLSVLFIPFIMWLYYLLRQRQHPMVAGVLMLFFMAMPEVYAYTYVLLYDYSNMIFFFAGYYFLARFFADRRMSDLAFSAFLFGVATYIRTETLVLVAMTAPLLLWHIVRTKSGAKAGAIQLAVFMLVPAAFYFLCINVFVRAFVPLPFDLAGQINPNLSNFSEFSDRLVTELTGLIFSPKGVILFGYFVFLFCTVLLGDLIIARRVSREARVALYGIAVVIIGLPLLGYLLPVVDMANTTKRGLFKMLPLMLLFMANSGVLQRLSGKIREMETPAP